MTQSLLQSGQVQDSAACLTRPRHIPVRLENRIGHLAMARLYSMIDQGASGVANIIALAILGRVLPVEQFGAIGMMIGLHYFVAGFHRSAIVLPYLTVHHAEPASAAIHVENSAWWWISTAGALAVSALLAAAGLMVSLIAPVFPTLHWLVTPLFLSAVVTPSMLAAEFTRRWLFKIDRADLVAVFALVYFCVLIGSALVATRLNSDAGAGALTWAAASIGVTTLALCVLRPVRVLRPVIGRIVHVHRAEAGWLASANLPYSVYGSATIVILIGMLVGPVAAGIFTAVRTLTNPAMSIVSAIDSTDKPRATRALAEAGMAGLQRAITRTRALIGLTTGAYLGAVALWADQLATLVYDEHYTNVTVEVRLLALAFFLAGLNQPSETRLIVLKAGRTMLIVRSITAVLAIASLTIAASWGVTGMAVAITGIQIFNLLLLWLAERRVASKGIAK